MDLDGLLRDWDGEQVVAHRDTQTGSLVFVCLHSTRRGPAAGGTRMKPYGSALEALGDAMRLAAAMTLKMAVHDVPLGGGKAVVAVTNVPAGAERTALLERYADVIESLGGRFATGPDMNTSAADMDVIGERTQHVFCRTAERGGSGDPSPSTALGVYHGIRASLRHATGSDEPRARTIVVQGVGSVGGRLAELLAADGARVVVCDVDAERAETLARRLDAEVVSAEEALGRECDVFAPCAAGGVIGERELAALRCRVVAGAANNPLVEDADAERLRDAGILYAPDYVINGGGALHGAGLELLGWDRPHLERRLRGIGDTLADLYRQADADGTTPLAAAEALARSRLG